MPLFCTFLRIPRNVSPSKKRGYFRPFAAQLFFLIWSPLLERHLFNHLLYQSTTLPPSHHGWIPPLSFGQNKTGQNQFKDFFVVVGLQILRGQMKVGTPLRVNSTIIELPMSGTMASPWWGHGHHECWMWQHHMTLEVKQQKGCLTGKLVSLRLHPVTWQYMSPPCQFYNIGFIYFNLNYIITMLKSFNIKKYSLFQSFNIPLMNHSEREIDSLNLLYSVYLIGKL